MRTRGPADNYRFSGAWYGRKEGRKNYLDEKGLKMKTITAKYDGYCTKTGARILAGDIIQWQRGRAVLLERRAARVDTFTFSGENGPRDYYRNARGRCEDAPCCGCCTI